MPSFVLIRATVWHRANRFTNGRPTRNKFLLSWRSPSKIKVCKRLIVST